METRYSFVEGGHGADSTTSLVKEIDYTGITKRKYIYTYDEVGNITSERWEGNKGDSDRILTFEGSELTLPEGNSRHYVTMPSAYMEGPLMTTYEYDDLGQLTRINDPRAGTTWTYTYDQGGNILKKNTCPYTTGPFPSSTIELTYTYGDPNWKDKLTAYCGMPITYDAIGNPLSYNGWTYTWKAGRMLHSMAGNGVNAQFTYDHTGLRVKKTVNGVDTLYTLNGKKITHIRKGTTQMHFFYDAQGQPSIIRYNGNDYTYIHNLQGDIVAIVDQEGRSVVEYSYDAWGRPVYSSMGKTCTGSMADTLGVENPFRYRGYVYDEETGLYYLRSRYYDPEWGRFLNADTFLGQTGALLSHSGFAYCCNNPIILHDPSGNIPQYNDPKYIAAMEARGRMQMILAHSAAKKRKPNPEAKTVTVDEFLANLHKFLGVDTRSGDEATGCGTYMRAGVLGTYGGSHKVYHGGIPKMFRYNTIFSGKIDDIGGVDGLIPGMILSSENQKHGGVYAGLRDFGDGKGEVPAIYQFIGIDTNRDDVKDKFYGVLQPYSKSAEGYWVNYGWHEGVVFN